IPDVEYEDILEYISPKGIKVGGTVKFEVRAAVRQTGERFLRESYSANGDIIIHKKDSVLAIKEIDIIYEGDVTYVEIKNGDTYDRKKIETGISDGLNTEVLSGLDTTMQVKVQQENPG